MVEVVVARSWNASLTTQTAALFVLLARSKDAPPIRQIVDPFALLVKLKLVFDFENREISGRHYVTGCC